MTMKTQESCCFVFHKHRCISTNEFRGRHAEDMFTLANDKVQDGRMLPKVYITYSPCSKCAKTLLKFFKKIGGFRQTLYIGKIYKPDHETEDSLCAMWNAQSVGNGGIFCLVYATMIILLHQIVLRML